MATILLSAAGAAIGSGFGGTVLGLSGAVIGRAVGATVGQAIDQRVLGAGSDAVETGRIDRLRLMGSAEGAGIARLWGRVRVSGQVIWATRFLETVTTSGGGGSGKGGARGARSGAVSTYSYSVSLAVALCEGEILRVGRIWADGNEITPSALNMRVYPGTDTQLPDPKIEAVEGAGNVPAYRGMAYVVIDDLPLAAYGNRVPQLSFEVIRPAQSDSDTPRPAAQLGLPDLLNGVAIIPGTGEYSLATTPVFYDFGRGAQRSANKNTLSGVTDFTTSLADLQAELPRAGAVSLVVSWFGDDLRCGACTVRPKVEQTSHDGAQMPWRVSGTARAAAALVPRQDGRPIYGGTPSDQSVIEAIRALKAAGKDVTFYPFILMDQLAGNSLPNPYSDTAGQPALPWRGRITGSIAPGRAGSPDGTAAATAEIDAFFGATSAAQFSHTSSGVSYTGPNTWTYRRFILHYAHLCAAAGGVDSFMIGSEMRGLTQLRGGNHSFPAVTRLRNLAADVRAVLGPNCKISYAADWSEYFGAHLDGNIYFHLDPLWADANITYIAIDNYMPLADWRAGDGHADAAWGSVLNVDYLAANVAGGEGYDWFYASPEAEAAQIRTPILDAEWGEDWIYRYKDLRGWWQNFHHQRIGGVRADSPTAWVPTSKPFRFTEYGCAAIDKGANQPNRFLDAKSSEGGVPKYSTGQRDDAMQLAYYAAMHSYWGNGANNPVSGIYGAPMLDFATSLAWAWDARPFPDFPRNTALWSDGDNYEAGHWINGRTGNQPLGGVIGEIAAKSGLEVVDTARAYGVVRGYASAQTSTARAMLQPLLQASATEVIEREGTVRFTARALADRTVLDAGFLVRDDEFGGALEVSRAALSDDTSRLRLSYIAAEGSYGARVAEAIYPDLGALSFAQSEMPLVLTEAEARAMAQRFMAESRIGRDTARFGLPKSMAHLGAGDIVQIGGQSYRIDRADLGAFSEIAAVRVDKSVLLPAALPALARTWRAPQIDAPVDAQFYDLPLLTGEEVPHAPYVSAYASPWRGPVAVWSSVSDDDYAQVGTIAAPAVLGVTQSDMAAAQIGVWDRGPALRLRLDGGELSSASIASVLSGQNVALIGGGTADADAWEVFQFATATLVAPLTYDLSLRLRGQSGSDGEMAPIWPAGSQFVLVNAALVQIDLPASARGLLRNYRIGRASAGYDAPETVHRVQSFAGAGLRPYSVAHLRARKRGGDVDVTWLRRTRLDGDSWEGVEVPLGETSETYTLRITRAGISLRDVILSAPAFTYSAAMQAGDGVTAGQVIEITVAQRSDAYGVGPARTVQMVL
jgi:hypothetical protein